MTAVSKVLRLSQSRLVLSSILDTSHGTTTGTSVGRCLHSSGVKRVDLTSFRVPCAKTLLQCRLQSTNSADNIDEDSGLPLFDPKKGILLYSGTMSTTVRNLKMLSISTSILAFGSQPFIVSAAKDDFVVKAGLLSTMSLMVFCTPLLLHFVTKKYVTDIYFNEETKVFTLATRSIFLRRKEVEYSADDVVMPLVGGLFVTHTVKNRPYFIEFTEFRSKELYKHMVGYDKPLDAHWPIKDPNAHMKPRKKFGLFEDEDLSVKETEDASNLWKSKVLHDDDDDLNEKKVQKKKGGAN